MSICNLTTGFTIGCRDAAGGTNEVYLLKWNSGIEYTTDIDGKVISMTSSPVPEIYKYDLMKNTASLEESQTMTAENETISYAPVLTMVINKLSTGIRNEMLLIARTPVIAIVKDKSGKYWLAGRQAGLDLLSSTRGTGTNINDRNGSVITLTGSESEPFVEIEYSAFSSFISSVQI